MVFFRTDDDEEEVENPEDEDAALADDVLDEVESDDVVAPDELEGFGLMDETAALAVEEKDEEKEGEEEGDAPLEEDAEDVDFDTFDDVDEM